MTIEFLRGLFVASAQRTLKTPFAAVTVDERRERGPERAKPHR